jgi:hypothetical protein
MLLCAIPGGFVCFESHKDNRQILLKQVQPHKTLRAKSGETEETAEQDSIFLLLVSLHLWGKLLVA